MISAGTNERPLHLILIVELERVFHRRPVLTARLLEVVLQSKALLIRAERDLITPRQRANEAEKRSHRYSILTYLHYSVPLLPLAQPNAVLISQFFRSHNAEQIKKFS